MIYDYNTGEFLRVASDEEVTTYHQILSRRTGNELATGAVNGREIADDLQRRVVYLLDS